MTREVPTVESALLLLCRGLAADPDAGGAESAQIRQDAWPDAVRLATENQLRPTLWAALRHNPLAATLPAALREELQRDYLRNVFRNQRLQRQCVELTVRLNAIGVEPIALKGSASLFDGSYGDPGARFMYDLDLLIPAERIDEIVGCAETLGYRTVEDEITRLFDFKPMAAPGRPGFVEFHRYVGAQRPVLQIGDAWAAAERLPARHCRLLALSPTHRALHNLLHSELQDRGHELGLLGLRQLHDLTMLCRRHNDRIDWRLVAGRLDRHRLGPMLPARLYMAHRLLGLKLPPGVVIDRRARRHLARCLLQLRWPALHAVVSLWGGATMPFQRHNIDLTYHCGTGFWAVNRYRARHLLVLARKYRGQSWRKVQTMRARYR